MDDLLRKAVSQQKPMCNFMHVPQLTGHLSSMQNKNTIMHHAGPLGACYASGGSVSLWHKDVGWAAPLWANAADSEINKSCSDQNVTDEEWHATKCTINAESEYSENSRSFCFCMSVHHPPPSNTHIHAHTHTRVRAQFDWVWFMLFMFIAFVEFSCYQCKDAFVQAAQVLLPKVRAQGKN